MRLDDFDPNIHVEDQRGNSGSGFGGGGGGGVLFGLLPLVFSRFGCGGVVVLLIVFAVFGGGLNLLGGGGSQLSSPTAQIGQQQAGHDTNSSCKLNDASKVACDVFTSTNKTWAAIFQQSGQRFVAPKLVFYGDQGGRSGCGAAQSAMGPFYCPQDQGIYLDTNFFGELATRFGAKGDFAQDYVVAHEFGHHIQNLLGTSDKVAQAQRSGDETTGNRESVKLELQADCYAGVWAAANKDRMDPGDLEEGMTAARAIGDDTLQQESQGRVMPDSFTHGTSEQRMTWLKRGLDSGDPAQCDTFSGGI